VLRTFPEIVELYVGAHLYNINIGREMKSEVPKIKIKKVENRLDKLSPSLYNSNNEANNKLAHYKEAR
jgi:hypothetical protein